MSFFRLLFSGFVLTVFLAANAMVDLSDDAAADFLWLMPNLIVTKADVTGVDSNRTSLSFDMTGVNAPAA